MNKELEKYLENPSFLQNVGNGILLSKEEENILNKYEINYQNCKDTRELIFKIEDYLNGSYEDLEDLDDLSNRLSEFNYYQNTNK